MQKDTITTCLAAPILGAFGFFFRWLQLDNSFEDATGLPISDSLWHKTMFLLCAAVLVFFLARVILMRIRQHPFCRDISLATQDTSLLFYGPALGFSLLIAASGAILFMSTNQHLYAGLYRLLGFLIILTGSSTAALALTFRFPIPAKIDLRCVFSVIPVVTVCFWLFLVYHENAGNPTIWSYSIYILTVCGILLSFFFLSGYFFETPRPLLLVFTASLTVFLCITSMADAHSFAIKLLMLGIAGILLIFAMKIVPSGNKKH